MQRHKAHNYMRAVTKSCELSFLVTVVIHLMYRHALITDAKLDPDPGPLLD